MARMRLLRGAALFLQEAVMSTRESITDVPTGKSAPEGEVQQGAWLALSVLVLINLFNYIDRQVLAAVEPQIRQEFFGPDVLNPATGKMEAPPDSKTWMGALPFAFLITYMLTAPIFGALANRVRRWLLIGVGVVLWSLASGGSGMATAFVFMLLMRCFVGIGEAVYGPVAPDMISDLYPVRKRGQVMAWFYAAIPFGGALGYALGSTAYNLSHSWRTGFYVVVPPGILLGLWCFLLPEPRRGQTAPADPGVQRERLKDYLILARTPSYVLNTLGMTAMTAAMGGLAWWAPAYLDEHKVPHLFGLDPVFAFGVLTAVSGLVATLAGGIAGDLLRRRFSGSYFLVSGVAMVLAFPMLLLVTFTPFPLAWIPLTTFVFLLFFNTGPTNTILANVTHPLLRAPGFALNILIIHLFGDAVSPIIMGAIADRYEKPLGLEMAFRVISVAVLIGGLLWLWGMRHLARDTALAPHRLS
jgi:MFS family permease